MSTVSYKDRKQIVLKFVEGEDIKNIAQEFGVSKTIVNSIIDKEQETRTELERIHANVSVARENREIDEVKNEALKYTKAALEEGLSSENKLKYIDKIAVMVNAIDRISRLNRGGVTDRSESSSAIYNVSEIMKQFQTPEEKKEYLLKKLTKGL